MATTTPNYGWPVPTSTDYVKDGATAIEALGDAIDATVFALPSKVVQIKNTQSGTIATGTTTIPLDNTIPQITEGTQFITLSFTPTSATNNLMIDFVGYGAGNSTGAIITALFVDSTANALAATSGMTAGPDYPSMFVLRHTMVAGSTTARTFRIRIGAQSASTVTFNGNGGNQLFGGVGASSITVTEYKP